MFCLQSCRKNTSNKFLVVETEYGPVKGLFKSTILGVDYVNFQGIPYMKPPVGKLRFRDAQPPEKWTEPIEPQEVRYPELNFVTNTYVGQEDAGVINVYTKNVNPSEKYPVFVWIHGGGFEFGSANTDFYGPDYILEKDVVIASFNYRCGAFGFLSFDDPELGIPGNAGLKDQTFALKWIQRNIGKFGGDPEKVTICGESAGGASVHYHMISEHSRDLFHRAIPMSGVAVNGWALHPQRNWAFRLANVLGYEGSQNESDILEFLESVDAFEIVKNLQKVLTLEERHGEKMSFPFGPQIEPYESENCFIPKDPLIMAREAWSNSLVDCLIGGVSNEGIVNAFPFGLLNDFTALETLKDPKYFAPLIESGLTADDPKSIEFGKLLKRTYYGCTEPSKSNTEGYFYYIGDYLFWHGIQRAALLRASKSSAKTFVYRYDVVTKLNFLKKFYKCDDHPGAEHTSDFFHLFKGTYITPPSIDSIEFKNVKKTVDIFTSFAIDGIPNCNEFGDEWHPIKSTELPIKVMNIGTQKCNFIDLPETERLKVWNKIFIEAGIELF